MSERKESYTLAEIANRWGVSHSSVLTLIYKGTLRALDVSSNPTGRSRFIVLADDLAAFEDARRTLPPVSPPKRRRVRVNAGEIIEFIR